MDPAAVLEGYGSLNNILIVISQCLNHQVRWRYRSLCFHGVSSISWMSKTLKTGKDALALRWWLSHVLATAVSHVPDQIWKGGWGHINQFWEWLEWTGCHQSACSLFQETNFLVILRWSMLYYLCSSKMRHLDGASFSATTEKEDWQCMIHKLVLFIKNTYDKVLLKTIYSYQSISFDLLFNWFLQRA